jgi:NAD-dependent protein deacetylase/lipoamidase
LDDLISKAAGDLMTATHVIALTGAGISVESGIPPFRGTGGIWEKIDPMEYAHIDAFMSDPVKVWDVLIRGMKEVVDQAVPNNAHKGLARLEELGIIKTVITQNVDGLHQAAGSTDVIEFHGNFAWQSCIDCGRRRPTRTVKMDRLPPRCTCGGILRPECVFFGEQIPPRHLSRSKLLAMQCDIMLVIGTSATVQPAATIPIISKQSGTRVIEINTEPTPLTHSVSDYLIAGRAGEVMHRIVAEVERKKRLG